MIMQDNEKKPALRFKGFTDPWEQRKFSELYEKVSRKNDLTYGKDDIISVANMYYKAESYITDENYLLTYNVFEMGDIAFEGNKSKNFAHGRFVENTIGNGIVSHVFDVFKPRMTNYDLQFWKYAINNERIMGPILLRSTKASTMMTNLVADDFLQENFLIPCYEEQKKIGEFLNQLDTLITLHQRKYEKLVNIKKSMLDKMFPKNGASVPEIRFKGFTDPWEQRKFSDITFPAGEKNRDNLPLESYSITNEHGFIPQDEKFENGGTMREADKRMYYIVSPNSFAYNPARINVGSIGYQNTGKDVIVSSLYEVFKTSDDVDDRLLWHWFKSPDFQKLIFQLQEGGVRLYFYYDKLCMGTVSLPSLEEQRKIGQLFDSLDTLITLHQRKLEKLQNIKKSCLEKMFV